MLIRNVSATGEGKITGTVKLAGTAPHQRAIDMSKEPYCQKLHADHPVTLENVVVGSNGGLQNVVVYVSVFDDVGRNLVATKFPLTPGFQSGSPDASGMLVYRNAIQIRKGERHRVVVAVRDAITDSVGMATEVVKF